MDITRVKRVLFKLSGEVLMGDAGYGVDPVFLGKVADDLKRVSDLGIQLGLVVGGGNIFRGLSTSAKEMERTRADRMGMLATVINGLALADALENRGVQARVMSALAMPEVAESFVHEEAIRHLDEGRVVIFVAGTGNPFFTTDTAAALRAVEIKADLLLKGTKVDGVYSADPEKVPDATRFDALTYEDVLSRSLRVMDLTATTLCRENALPIRVFSIRGDQALSRQMRGEGKGTWIEER
ncbi:MAG: UMP kinase [Magnetococcales bacterium]|nr:UMP kinase [Magnetococcales bacterium]